MALLFYFSGIDTQLQCRALFSQYFRQLYLFILLSLSLSLSLACYRSIDLFCPGAGRPPSRFVCATTAFVVHTCKPNWIYICKYLRVRAIAVWMAWHGMVQHAQFSEFVVSLHLLWYYCFCCCRCCCCIVAALKQINRFAMHAIAAALSMLLLLLLSTAD